MIKIFRKNKKEGFTLAEVLTASVLTVIVLGVMLMLNEFVQKSWMAARAKSEISAQLATGLERIQKEIRFTDASPGQVFYYDVSGEHVSVSFPDAVPDALGFIPVTATDPPRIAWNRTIIYYIWHNDGTGKDELRRMVCSRNVNMTDSDRQDQINYVVTNNAPVPLGGDGYEPCVETRTLCSNDSVILKFLPMIFDGYTDSATPVRSTNPIGFGSVLIGAAPHTITFQLEGKNPASSGYKLGIDCFSIVPSGCQREAEEASVNAHGGGAIAYPDMQAYGNWNGNYQLEYTPGLGHTTSGSDYITLNFDYDACIETNFSTADMLNYSGLAFEYSNRTGGGTVVGLEGRAESGAKDCIARLGGCDTSWSASEQAGPGVIETAQALTIPPASTSNGIFIRNVLLSQYVKNIEGKAIRIKFNNISNTTAIPIDSASIMERDSGCDGKISGASFPVTDITFQDAGAVSPYTSIIIPANQSRYSDWININPYFTRGEYLVTLHVNLPEGTYSDIGGWLKSDSTVCSYLLKSLLDEDTVTENPIWSGYPSTDRTQTAIIYLTESLDVSYFSSGYLISKVYDTGVDDTPYTTLTWNIASDNYGTYPTGAGADLKIKVGCKNNDVARMSDTDWGVASGGVKEIDTQSGTQPASPKDISSIGTGRYLQFRLDFSAKPDARPLMSCVLKNLTIKWPGQAGMVGVNGYLTMKNDYGMYSIKVDGKSLMKGLRAMLEISKNLPGGNVIKQSRTVEAEPRNTGK